MSDVIDLPTLPRDSTPPPYSTAHVRKRSRPGYASSNSSDAPFFSSDDLAEASIDNYVSPRRKRQYKRAWYESEGEETPQAPSHKGRRDVAKALAKAKDSGVFMASDSSSNDDGFNVTPISVASLRRPEKKFGPFLHMTRGLEGEALVQKVVYDCLEACKEVVDLSDCGLTSISDETIRQLQHLIRHPQNDHHPHVEEAFRSFTPSLKLFLSSNQLTNVPPSIVTLENLTVLSLRNNNITELPHSIGKLRNLVELNVAGNQLRWLPWELLNLVEGKLVNLSIGPNPLLQDFQQGDTPPSSRWKGMPESESPWKTVYVASTPRTFFELDGSVARTGNQVLTTTAASTPSLFELAIQSCSDTIPMAELHKYLPEDTPAAVDRAFDFARAAAGEGGRACSVCKRRFVVPRAEWIEYWRFNPLSLLYENGAHPFLRRSCSWKCAEAA